MLTQMVTAVEKKTQHTKGVQRRVSQKKKEKISISAASLSGKHL